MDAQHNTLNDRLAGRVALITGGTSGIGKATAHVFNQEGATVAFTGRRIELGKAVSAEIESAGGQVKFIPADHARAEDCKRAVDAVLAEFGRLDILFNNAGFIIRGAADELSEEDWQNTFDVNVTAVWRMSALAIPHMRAQGGGVIVNTASDRGLLAFRRAAAYCAAKGAVIQLTRAMALDHSHENIRINAVCPGDTFVERRLEEGDFKDVAPEDLDTALREAGAYLPIGRIGTAKEIANAVLFLASDDASFMTGATLVVDGGSTAG